MEKVTDKSARIVGMEAIWEKSPEVSSEVFLSQIWDEAYRAGLEEAARAMCQYCNNPNWGTPKNGKHEWSFQPGVKDVRFCTAGPIWAIRAIAQPEPPSITYEMSRISPQLCEVHGVVHKCEQMAATTAAKIVEALQYADELAEQIKSLPVKGREEAPTISEQSTIGLAATGASEAAVKDALLASEVPIGSAQWFARNLVDDLEAQSTIEEKYEYATGYIEDWVEAARPIATEQGKGKNACVFHGRLEIAALWTQTTAQSTILSSPQQRGARKEREANE